VHTCIYHVTHTCISVSVCSSALYISFPGPPRPYAAYRLECLANIQAEHSFDSALRAQSLAESNFGPSIGYD